MYLEKAWYVWFFLPRILNAFEFVAIVVSLLFSFMGGIMDTV